MYSKQYMVFLLQLVIYIIFRKAKKLPLSPKFIVIAIITQVLFFVGLIFIVVSAINFLNTPGIG